MCHKSIVLYAALIVLGNLCSLHAEMLPASAGHGLDSMAPAGHWAVRIEVRENSYDRWFDNSGNEQTFNAEYDGLDLNGSVFPALSLLGVDATLGTSSLYSRSELQATQLIVAYGINDNVTFGLILPYVETHSRIDFSVAGGNVGFNPLFDPDTAIGVTNFPFAPVGGTVTPAGTDGVKQLISDPLYGYGYAPVETNTTSGLSDSTAGVLWRYYQDDYSSALLGIGIRFGLASGDNPDSLVDIPIGDGSNDLRVRMEYFRDLGHAFDLHLLAESFTQLSDHVTMRVPQAGQLLATSASKERLERNLGDYQEYDVELGHHWADWRASVTAHLYTRQQDRYRSSKGTDTSELEANTRVRADQWRASLSWSGINSWREGNIPLPLIVKFETQDTYGGKNFPRVRDYYLQITSLF